jgi:hypothetical protein
VFDSSTTIARSGISAPITSHVDASVSAAATGAAVPGAT